MTSVSNYNQIIMIKNTIIEDYFKKGISDIAEFDIGITSDMSKREIYEKIEAKHLQNDEYIIVSTFVCSLVLHVVKHPAIASYFIVNPEERDEMLSDKHNIRDFSNIFSRVLSQLEKKDFNTTSLIAQDLKANGLLKQLATVARDKNFKFDTGSFEDVYNFTKVFLKDLLKVFDILSGIEKYCLKNNIDKESLCLYVAEKNKQVFDILMNNIFEILKVDNQHMFEGNELFRLVNSFGEIADKLDYSEIVLENRAKREEEKPKIHKSTVSAPVNSKEQERQAKIAKVNDSFERFKIEFLRDLQKEVSMMNRDMYNAFIDKFEKFINVFQMPLSNDVSLGKASEAEIQLNKLIETAYDISRNTYSPVVFNR